MGLVRPLSRPAWSRLASENQWAVSSAAAADLQSHREAAVRFACPGWALPVPSAPRRQVAMPARPASEKAKVGSQTARLRPVWRLQAEELLVRGTAYRPQLVHGTACRRQSAQQ
ncbi:hypothetical protein AYJ54_36595 [Bradyrhizobium centrolobii]|uniref:Uncharacterized protein n=1 Tax=Bradyrhizobium centrolobii TaxID=1505087 RepID=A0A176Y8F0_9BRAD|nr:hypothetical protein AYJ54_36595 [Bradyrhizobium centrolobii]